MPNKIHLILFTILVLILTDGYSQGSDIVVLKKRNAITKKTFFAGSQIQFMDISGSEVNGVIKKIANDSIYINLFDTRRQYTIWGTSFLDTIAVFTSRYHYKEIREIIKPARGFGFVKNGLIFIISGVGYAFLHTFNAIYLKEKIDGKKMALSGAAVLTGIVLKKTHHNSIRLGKQYYLQYIPLK